MTTPPAPPPDAPMPPESGAAEPWPEENWPGSGPPPPTWDRDDPAATSDAPPEAADPGGPPASDPPAGRTGPTGQPSYLARRLLVGGAAVVIVVLVVVLIVHFTGSDSTTTQVSPTTTVSQRNANAPESAVAALRFQPFTNGTPAFSIATPGAAKRGATATTGAVRFGPGKGSTVAWTLDVRPLTPGADFATLAKNAVDRRGGTITQAGDTGTLGQHVDEQVTGPRGAVVLVHIATGTNNLFVLTVPARSGGTALTGRAVFNQMSGTLRAPGIG
jgi:hypothetical protein